MKKKFGIALQMGMKGYLLFQWFLGIERTGIWLLMK